MSSTLLNIYPGEVDVGQMEFQRAVFEEISIFISIEFVPALIPTSSMEVFLFPDSSQYLLLFALFMTAILTVVRQSLQVL